MLIDFFPPLALFFFFLPPFPGVLFRYSGLGSETEGVQ